LPEKGEYGLAPKKEKNKSKKGKKK